MSARDILGRLRRVEAREKDPQEQKALQEQGEERDVTPGREAVRALYEINKELKNLPQPLPSITEAPEGYYYEAEGPGGYKEYNRQVEEYNRALREYKSKLVSAKGDAMLGIYDYELYSASYKLYQAQLQAAKPQRDEFLQYVAKYGPPKAETEEDRAALKQWESDPGYQKAFGEYLETMGPQPPTEEQRRRIAAGLPLTGIPGPGMGPAPGSVGAQMQTFMQETVERMDVPFKAITQPLRGVSERLETQGLESALEGNAVVGFAAYAGSVAIDTAAMAIDVATFELRPQLWVDVGRTLGGVVVDPDVRGAAWKEITYDPFRFVSTMAGGAYLGGVIRSKVGELPSRISRARARYDWSRYGDEALFNAAEMELGMQYPEEAFTYESTSQLYRRAQLTIYDRVGLIKEKLPYYIEAEPEFIRTQEIFEAAEEWSPTRVSGPESYYALPFDDKGGAILVKGKSGMKPIKEPSPISAPRSDAIQMVTTEGVVSTPIKSSLFTQAERLLEYVDYEPISSYIRPVSFKDILAPETIRVTTPVFTLRDLGVSASALKLSDLAVQRVSDIQKQNIAQIESQLEIQLPQTLSKLESKLRLTQPVMPIQAEIQLPKLEQIQKQDFLMPQLQLPKLETPQITMPGIPKIPVLIMPPRTPPRKVFKGKPEEKKKKKKGKKKRGVFELRFDFPDLKLPKEPEI